MPYWIQNRINIKYLRNGSTASSLVMDNMAYHFNTGNNQLNHFTDLVASQNRVE